MYTYTEAKGCWDGSSCWLLSVLCSSCLTRSTDRFNVSHVLVKTPVAETPWTQQRRHVSGLSSFSVANFHPSIYRQTSLLQHSGAGVDPGVDVGSTQTPSREIQGWESNPQPPCWTAWTASLFPEETHETLSSGVEAEHSCHSFASTNPNLTIKPWCAEAATLLGPGKASSVTWLHKSAPNQTTQQEKLLEHSSPGVGTRFRPGGWKPWKADTDRGGFNHPLCFLHLQNFSLSWRLQVFLTCSRGEFPFQLFPLVVLMSGRKNTSETANVLIASYSFTCTERTLNHCSAGWAPQQPRSSQPLMSVAPDTEKKKKKQTRRKITRSWLDASPPRSLPWRRRGSHFPLTPANCFWGDMQAFWQWK